MVLEYVAVVEVFTKETMDLIQPYAIFPSANCFFCIAFTSLGVIAISPLLAGVIGQPPKPHGGRIRDR